VTQGAGCGAPKWRIRARRRGTIHVVRLVMAAALWGLFSAWLLFPYLGVPRMLRRAIAMLLALEFVTITAWGFATEDCVHRPCSAVSETTRAAAGIDLPALGAVVVVLAVAYAIRSRRRAGAAVTRA
jgi:hypothetical protein